MTVITPLIKASKPGERKQAYFSPTDSSSVLQINTSRCFVKALCGAWVTMSSFTNPRDTRETYLCWTFHQAMHTLSPAVSTQKKA
ncbi:hypothetical protein SRHO_G00308210 [Serrasalmus rhombeus]